MCSSDLVSTDVGGMSQLIGDTLYTDSGEEIYGCGTLTVPGDVKGFADALELLMDNPEVYERYCVNAYERIEKFFQLRLVMDKYNQIYRKLGGLPQRLPWASAEDV